MASVFIQDQGRNITDIEQIRAYLKPYGIWYEHWEVTGRLPANPSDEQILET